MQFVCDFFVFWRAGVQAVAGEAIIVLPKVAAADNGMGAKPNEDSIESKLEGRLLKGTFSLPQISRQLAWRRSVGNFRLFAVGIGGVLGMVGLLNAMARAQTPDDDINPPVANCNQIPDTNAGDKPPPAKITA